jgi:hypothetical protein
VRGAGNALLLGSGALVSMESLHLSYFQVCVVGFCRRWLATMRPPGAPSSPRWFEQCWCGFTYAVPSFVVSADFGHVIGGTACHMSQGWIATSGDQKCTSTSPRAFESIAIILIAII